MSTKKLNAPLIRLHSVGYKRVAAQNAVLPRAHLYIDCRMMEDAAHTSGMTLQNSVDMLLASNGPQLERVVELIIDMLKSIPSRRNHIQDPYLYPIDVCFCCAWGIHRSPTTKVIMHYWLRNDKDLRARVTKIIGKNWRLEMFK